MLHQLSPAAGSRKRLKRVARGNSGNGGTTAGRGTKGQQARAGAKRRLFSEGGQATLFRRQPKLGGFNNPNRIDFEIVNLDTLEQFLEPGSYDRDGLKAAGVIRTKKPVKLLARGSVTKKFALTIDAVSDKARQAVEAAGGKIEVVSA